MCWKMFIISSNLAHHSSGLIKRIEFGRLRLIALCCQNTIGLLKLSISKTYDPKVVGLVSPTYMFDKLFPVQIKLIVLIQ